MARLSQHRGHTKVAAGTRAQAQDGACAGAAEAAEIATAAAAGASPGDGWPPSGRPAYQKYEVVNHKSRIDGFGAFAAEPIPAHRKIGEIRGESISVSEARRRAQGKARIMIVEVSARKAIDASQSADPMRFTNHSCQPNARLCIRDGRVEFYALRPIAPGEEITVNYGETHHEGTLKCRCGVLGCVGWL